MALTWRVAATLDTLLWSYLVTGAPVSAGQIAMLETMTKIALFYLHERIWRWPKWNAGGRARSLIKAISWRLIGSADTFFLSLLVTGSTRHAASIASLEAASKIVLYYLHERAWGRLSRPRAGRGSGI